MENFDSVHTVEVKPGKGALISERAAIERLWPRRHGTPALRWSIRRLIHLTREAAHRGSD